MFFSTISENIKIIMFISIIGTVSFSQNLQSMGFENRNSNYPQFTDHCFTGEYPVEPVDAKENKFEEKQISYLSSKN